jgi:magnesium transporter
MPELNLQEPWKDLRELLATQSAPDVMALLDQLSPMDIARALTRLDDDERHDLLHLIEPEEAAGLIEELSDVQAADLIDALPAEKAAEIVNELDSDHQADILAEMDEEDAEAILDHLSPEDAAEVRKLLQYPENTAGSIMITDFVVYEQDMTVADVIHDMRENAERYSDFGVQYAYVASKRGTLIGVIRMRDLLLARSEMPLARIMIVNPIYVLALMPLDEVEELFDRYTFWAVPVTDDEGKMVGVVRRSDLHEALGELQEQAFLRFSGIVGGEELRDLPLRERAGRRLSWLGLNMFLSICAASVILVFEGTISRVFALVFFMPIICNMSGCSGNQAVAVSIREMALGIIEPEDFARVWAKEFWMGVINGAVLGTILGTVAFLLNRFLWHDTPLLGLVIGGAFMLNTVIAVSLGGLIPLALKYLKADAALGAPPILTTITDMCGFLLVLTLATLALASGVL